MLESATTTAARRGLTAAWADGRAVVGAWAVSRALVVATALVLHRVGEPRGYFGPAIFRHALGPLEAWDGIWYRLIAHDG